MAYEKNRREATEIGIGNIAEVDIFVMQYSVTLAIIRHFKAMKWKLNESPLMLLPSEVLVHVA
jgi:hypothetical protein